MLEAKDQRHRSKCSPKIFFPKKLSSKKFLLLLELRSMEFYVQAYVNDLAVLVPGADMLYIRGMAQKAINIAANLAWEQELQFSNKKTEIVLFTHRRNPDLGFLTMNVLKLELSKEARLLDVTLDSKLTWKPHIIHITRKATTALMQCRQIVSKTRGNKTIYDEMNKHSYDGPIMLYSCRTAERGGAGGTMNPGPKESIVV